MDRTPSDSGPARLADPDLDFEPRPDAAGSAPSGGQRAVEPFLATSQPAGVSISAEAEPVFGAGTLGGNLGPGRFADRVLAGLSSGAGAFLVLLIGLVTLFLVIRALPAITADQSNFLTARSWDVGGDSPDFGVLPLLWVTVLVSLLAMAFAVPVAIGIALFISHYAPAQVARPVAYVIDLLAAIPSIIYGVWGIAVLAPKIQPLADLLSRHAGWFPLFADENVKGGTIFTGGVVLAVMILPIVTAIGRDVFERTPRANIEAAWALGATHWEVIRTAVLPYGRAGLVSGAMLGLGRALGETIAITLILSKVSNTGPFSYSIFNGGETFASKIANNASEFNSPAQTGAYIAAGLVLFVLTFAVNAAARWVVNRRKEFA
ncbi:phosphate ABC transporter permease subunit PstC [Jatrophihabitans sp.]|uniref:phosphate ABC transporter permease subunit PstC n=1 Tax=Jatrophihabitans sp. TaxID=1932789 RepID=UPI002C1FA5B2|nr:phosphate ABC transporter permease subunit PstC [Jatrophihabitans sp.]